MSFESNLIKKVGLYFEPSGAFGNNVSGSSAYSTFAVLDSGGTFTTDQEMVANNQAQQKIGKREKKIPGLKTCTAQLSWYLKGMGSVLHASGTIAPSTEGRLLQNLLGGYYAATGSTVASAASAAQITLAGAGGFPPGAAIGWVNAAGVMEVSRVLSRTAHTLHLQVGFSTLPTAGNPVYGSYNFWAAQNPSSSVQMLVEGQEAQDVFILGGMVGTPTFTLSPGQLLEAAVSLEGKSWFTGSTKAGLLTTGSHVQTTPIVFTDSEFLFYQAPTSNTAGATRVSLADHVSDISLTLNITRVPIAGISGHSNTQRYRRIASAEPVATVTFSTDYDSYDYWNSREDSDEFGMVLRVGSSVSSSVAFTCPRMQIVDVQRSDWSGGIAGCTVTAEALWDDLAGVDEHSEIATSPITISIFG